MTEITHDRAEPSTPVRLPKVWFIAVYLHDRAYGGPEEGGWWYDVGTLIRVVRLFKNEDSAIIFARRLNGRLDRTLNRDRHDVSSVLSDGQYGAQIWDDVEPPPSHYPTSRPRYE